MPADLPSLREPKGVAVDGFGDVYVINGGTGFFTVSKFNRYGKSILSWNSQDVDGRSHWGRRGFQERRAGTSPFSTSTPGREAGSNRRGENRRWFLRFPETIARRDHRRDPASQVRGNAHGREQQVLLSMVPGVASVRVID